MYKNLSDFISTLDKEGELLRIKTEVSSDQEICEITDRVSKSEGGGKALLFERVAGSSFPVITNMMGSEKRICLALGIENLPSLTSRIDALLKEATAPKTSLWDKLRTLPMLAEVAQWLPTRRNSRGENQQVVLQGEQIDLFGLPILKCWGHDGGRFVTLPMVNTLDPDSGQRNVGMYRMQVLDKQTTGMHWHVHKTGARHYEAYKKRGERMPVSVAIGGDPAYTYAATAPMPDNMDEYLLAGFLRRKRVELVKCITNDIYVPADCDFVIEGYVDPAEDKIMEGPFGDHTGFYSLQDLYPKFHVTAITHRRDAIYPATIVGIPPQEDAYIAMATERIFLSPIRYVLQPEVRSMSMPTAGTAHNIAILSIENRYLGQAQKVIQSMWGAGQMMFNKYLLITPEGTDVESAKDISALLRRVNPLRNIVRSEGVLDVLDHATKTMGFGGKLAFDLCSLPQQEPELQELRYAISSNFTSDERLHEQWSTLLLFGDGSTENFKCKGANYVLVFDAQAKGMSDYELLWLAAANTDPRRDVHITEDGVLWADARSKRPAKGENPARFPNVVTSLPEVVELVDAKWAEYGIGELVESPSRHYWSLLLEGQEDWKI